MFFVLIDMNECPVTCDGNADCEEKVGPGVTCTCKPGFSGDGQNCIGKSDLHIIVGNGGFSYWCLNRHLCILQERFAKKDLNCKFGHCFLRFIGKSPCILTNYTWWERGDSQL